MKNSTIAKTMITGLIVGGGVLTVMASLKTDKQLHSAAVQEASCEPVKVFDLPEQRVTLWRITSACDALRGYREPVFFNNAPETIGGAIAQTDPLP